MSLKMVFPISRATPAGGSVVYNLPTGTRSHSKTSDVITFFSIIDWLLSPVGRIILTPTTNTKNFNSFPKVHNTHIHTHTHTHTNYTNLTPHYPWRELPNDFPIRCIPHLKQIARV